MGIDRTAFDGSFGDTNINDIDGRGWRFGQQVPNNQITRTQDGNFSVLTAFPTEPMDAANDSFILWNRADQVPVLFWDSMMDIFVYELVLVEVLLRLWIIHFKYGIARYPLLDLVSGGYTMVNYTIYAGI